MTWQQRGLCADHGEPEMWFPANDAPSPHLVAEPIRICGECPVREECLAYAMDIRNRINTGIWGGAIISKENNRIVAGLPKVERIDRVRSMLTQGVPVDDIAVRLGLSYATVSKLVGQIRRQDRITLAGRNGVTRGGAMQPAKCATDAGYYRHLRTLNEPACQACLDAHSAVERARKAAREQAVA